MTNNNNLAIESNIAFNKSNNNRSKIEKVKTNKMKSYSCFHIYR